MTSAISTRALADKPVIVEPVATLQLDPLTTALGFVHLHIEAVLTPHLSIYVSPSLHLFPGILAEDDDVPFTGLGGELGFRYYFNGNAPQGCWALVRGVLAGLSTNDVLANGAKETSVGGYVSVLAGHTWLFDHIWVLSAGAGIQYLDYQVAGAGPKGVLPALHTAFGVAF